jgi:hypothetical protein
MSAFSWILFTDVHIMTIPKFCMKLSACLGRLLEP